MCYEHFECLVGSQTLVYPDASGEDDDVMRVVSLKKWD